MTTRTRKRTLALLGVSILLFLLFAPSALLKSSIFGGISTQNKPATVVVVISESEQHPQHYNALDALGLTAESVLFGDDGGNNDNATARDDNSTTLIRSWGCNLTATPFIFAHIGKAGGGTVRRRIAAAALNITRPTNAWNQPWIDNHYYPVIAVQEHDKKNESNNSTARTTTIHRAKFCTSRRTHHQPGTPVKTFEGMTQQCTAQTPLGNILACPEMFAGVDCDYYHPRDPNAAHLVYAGHNKLGSELHWLPISYLQNWWSTYWSSSNNDEVYDNDPVLQKMETLDGVQPWCQDKKRPLLLQRLSQEDRLQYWSCARSHIQPQADDWAAQAVNERLFGSSSFSANTDKDHSNEQLVQLQLSLTEKQQGRAWGQFYASLPVMRVTVLREPFSWLTSKHSWHHLGTQFHLACDDLEMATRHDQNVTNSGWARQYPLSYIFMLCGEDCQTRMAMGHATLEQVEAQAAYNLRNSFAVVGLLHEEETFFDMIHVRVDYLNMRNLDQVADAGDHKSKKDTYCAERFQDPQYQQELLKASPELAALKRLYEIGVEVNRFQMQELEQCSGLTLVPN